MPAAIPMRRIPILLLLFLFIPTAVLLSQKLLTNQLIHGSSTFGGRPFTGVKWVEEGAKYWFQKFDTSTRSNNIYTFRLSDKTTELVVDASKLRVKADDPTFRYSSYGWSPDEKSVLLVSAPPERQYLSRLTPAGNLYLYSMTSKSFRQLTFVSQPQYNQKFSPDGKQVGFVRGNNLFVLDLESGRETQLTTDGTEHIINGKFDWVYEEEFGISDGWQWSPDGSKIAFWRLDENRVPEFHLMDFMTLRADVRTMRYPKSGDPNSIVKIGVMTVSTKNAVWMDLGTDDDIYIPRMQWVNASTLSIERLNRAQNKLEVLSGNVETGATRTVFTEEEKTWLNVRHDSRMLNASGELIWISEKDGYAQIYDVDATGVMRQVTRGAWEVVGINGVDTRTKIVYFTATAKTPLEHQFYSVHLDGSEMKQITQDGFSHSINLAPDAKHFLDTYSNGTTPPSTALSTIAGKLIMSPESNEGSALKEYDGPRFPCAPCRESGSGARPCSSRPSGCEG
jgi:dipeptidyl-peptidase-4